jgi:hypothetical protein
MGEQEQASNIGQVLDGRYRIISDGVPHDLGTLYQAHDMPPDRLVEVLLLNQRHGGDSGGLNRASQANRAVAGLKQPTLVAFEHIGLIGGQFYLVRNPLPGRPLVDLLALVRSLKIDLAVEITIRVCEALAPLHRAGLVHGGLSSHSVLVKVEDHELMGSHRPDSAPVHDRFVTVVDAGLVPALRPDRMSPGQPWGRFPYLSPEQAAGERAQPASDVYVLGSLLYEMLAGRPPFRSADETILVVQHLRQEPAGLQILVPQAPEPLVQIVHRALAKEPAARYRNAGQLAHILRSQAGDPLMPGHVPGPVPQASLPVPGDGRLVVPAPPVLDVVPDASAPVVGPPTPARGVPVPEAPGIIYDSGRDDYWTDEAGGVDWLLIGLIIAALISVLGLIPLWRTVYRRYAVPEPAAYRLEPEVAAWLWPHSESCEGDDGGPAVGLGPAAGRVRPWWFCCRHLPGNQVCPELALEKGAYLTEGSVIGLGVQLTGFKVSLC